jgi:hypothetical protein
MRANTISARLKSGAGDEPVAMVDPPTGATG